MDRNSYAVIRLSTPDDSAEIERLVLAQYRRTPWPLDGYFPIVQAFHVCERGDHIAACCGYRRDGQAIRVMHVWAEDGFGGRRAAVELMLDMEAMADAEGRDLVFDTMPENRGLRRAVAEHKCEPLLQEPGAVTYMRKAKVEAWAGRQ